MEQNCSFFKIGARLYRSFFSFTNPFFFTYAIKLKAKVVSPHNPLLTGGRKKKRDNAPGASSDSVLPGLVFCWNSLFLTLQQHDCCFGMEQLGKQHSTTD